MCSFTFCHIFSSLTSKDASQNWNVASQQRVGYLSESLPDLNQLLYRQHVALTRRKRNILFPSGVKVCTQETFDQAITNHLNYFHLRGKTALCCGFSSHYLCLVSLRVSHMQNFLFSTFFPLTLQVFHWSSYPNRLISLNSQFAVIKGSRSQRGQRSQSQSTAKTWPS